mmetsp:Transcript_21591/g.29389  ORF Transcript_21591/g.29389 Transcript_21591/m.29389 type:complete len:126 (-) Transcript_21591:116-493(-)|eukprot:CAMPEP_0185766226 /NCGR_PEP_ID=MMETSP1174-20130828/35772_1 /TAXON_ID=35687 /ORGANISM="Dictyocha speculum, Strain CCMP1381" /LENGTH=125 /DNA_ID=CAMNT_0028449781 /DNA_START=50 /DNA_END=427 /DNA_ORIENTATION=-
MMLSMIQLWLEKHGWTAVVVIGIFLFLYPRITKFIDDINHRASLRAANDPRRTRVLEIERQRVRAQQQANLASQEIESEKILRKKEKPKYNRGERNRHDGFNPLDGGGYSGGSYKPVSRKKQGGG